MNREYNGITQTINLKCGNITVTVNHPYELFLELGKTGGCISSKAEAIGRLISLLLQKNISPKEISQCLSVIKCNYTTPSCFDIIKSMLEMKK